MQNNVLFDLIPLVGFFLTYYITKNIFISTLVCIIASFAQIILCKLKYGKVPKTLWLSTLLITVLGGLTILLHNKTFVMLKPTALFWIIGASLIISQFAGKNGIKALLGKEINLSVKIWNQLNTAWALFFIALGGLNLFIALDFSEYTWVKFKVFGTSSLTLIFGIVTSIYIYIKQKKA